LRREASCRRKFTEVLDYPLAAILIAGPLVLDFDNEAATVIALVFDGGATVLAVRRRGRPGSSRSSRRSFTATWTRW
jgi:hypothetical protein